MLAIVSTGVSHGRLRALQTVAGTTLAMSIQLAIAAMGTAWFVRMLGDGFLVLRLAGIAYLLVLGVRSIRNSFVPNRRTESISAVSGFLTGFVVSLSNPKTILFFTAFLPQFVPSSTHYHLQIAGLSVSFLCMAAIIDAGYAFLSASAGRLVAGSRIAALHERLGGILYIVTGLWLAVSRRTP